MLMELTHALPTLTFGERIDQVVHVVFELMRDMLMSLDFFDVVNFGVDVVHPILQIEDQITDSFGVLGLTFLLQLLGVASLLGYFSESRFFCLFFLDDFKEINFQIFDMVNRRVVENDLVGFRLALLLTLFGTPQVLLEIKIFVVGKLFLLTQGYFLARFALGLELRTHLQHFLALSLQVFGLFQGKLSQVLFPVIVLISLNLSLGFRLVFTRQSFGRLVR